MVISNSNEHLPNDILTRNQIIRQLIKVVTSTYPTSVLGKLFLLGEKCFNGFSTCFIFILKLGFEIVGLVFDDCLSLKLKSAIVSDGSYKHSKMTNFEMLTLDVIENVDEVVFS